MKASAETCSQVVLLIRENLSVLSAPVKSWNWKAGKAFVLSAPMALHIGFILINPRGHWNWHVFRSAWGRSLLRLTSGNICLGKSKPSVHPVGFAVMPGQPGGSIVCLLLRGCCPEKASLCCSWYAVKMRWWSFYVMFCCTLESLQQDCWSGQPSSCHVKGTGSLGCVLYLCRLWCDTGLVLFVAFFYHRLHSSENHPCLCQTQGWFHHCCFIATYNVILGEINVRACVCVSRVSEISLSLKHSMLAPLRTGSFSSLCCFRQTSFSCWLSLKNSSSAIS